MKNIFNAYLLKATLVILTPSLSVSLWAQPKGTETKCPELKTAEEAFNFFVQADQVGARLTSDTVAKLKNCISFDDENAWDLFQVVSSYELKECSGKKVLNKTCLEIKYGTYGELFSSKPFSKNQELKFKTQKVELVKEGDKWMISGLREIPPMLSKEGAISYLQTSYDKENAQEQNEWLKSAGLAIENLKE